MRLAHSNILTVFLFTSFLQKQHKQHGTALNIKPLQQVTNSTCIRDDERLPTFTGLKEFFALCLDCEISDILNGQLIFLPVMA